MAIARADLIRLVAARYDEMQGLRTAGDAVLLMLAGAGLRLVVATNSDRVVVAIALLLLVCLYAWLRRMRPRLDTYYRTRFGRVGSFRRRFGPGESLMFAMGTGWV